MNGWVNTASTGFDDHGLLSNQPNFQCALNVVERCLETAIFISDVSYNPRHVHAKLGNGVPYNHGQMFCHLVLAICMVIGIQNNLHSDPFSRTSMMQLQIIAQRRPVRLYFFSKPIIFELKSCETRRALTL